MEKTENTRICLICGKQYAPRNARQKYCSTACNREAQRIKDAEKYYQKKEAAGDKHVLKVCPICGKEFSTDKSFKLYCSPECYALSRTDKQLAYREAKRNAVNEASKKGEGKRKIGPMDEYLAALRSGETNLTYGKWQAQRWKDRVRVILPEWAEEAKRGIRTQKFTISGRLPNMNDLIKGHWTVQQQKKKEAMNSALAAARWGKIKPVERYPVLVKINCFEPNARRDQDNVQAGAKKIILDALQRAGILAGDGQKYVADIICPKPLIDRDNPRVEVVLKEGAEN